LVAVLLGDLLRRSDLCALVSADPGDKERVIRWTHVTELLDPTPYLRGGELVLTNGLWRQRRRDCGIFTDHLIASGATALALGLSSADEPIPKELEAACRERRLPLLEVRPPVSFSEISEAVAEHYAEVRSLGLLHSVDRNEALLGTLVAGSGARGLLRVLEREHEIVCALLDRAGHVLAVGGEAFSEGEQQAVIDYLGQEQTPPELPLDDGRIGRIVPVEAVPNAQALLLCRGARSKLNDAETRAGIEQTASFLALELARQQAVRAIEHRFAGELIQLIAAGQARRAETEERLRALGLDPERALAVVAISGNEARQVPQLAEGIERFFTSRAIPVVVPVRSEEVLAILEWVCSAEELADAARELADNLDGTVAVGVGTLAHDAPMLRKSLAEARHACRMAIRAKPDSRVLTNADIGSYSLVFALADRDVAEAFRSRVLGAVIAYDEQHGTDLLHTLEVFFETCAHWKATAERLHVHVNTLRNRLSRIEDLTGRSLADMEDRVDLFLALRAGDHHTG